MEDVPVQVDSGNCVFGLKPPLSVRFAHNADAVACFWPVRGEVEPKTAPEPCAGR